MARRSSAAYVAPSTRNGPLAEYADESVFDWLRRQHNPPKPATPAVLAIVTAPAKKNAPESVAADLEGLIPEGTN